MEGPIEAARSTHMNAATASSQSTQPTSTKSYAGTASRPASESMRLRRATARAAIEIAAVLASAAAAATPNPAPAAIAASVPSTHPARPERNAMEIATTPPRKSAARSITGAYSQKRIAGPASGPSVRKLLHANATAP